MMMMMHITTDDSSKKMKIMKCSIFQSLDWNLTPPEPREPNNSIALGIEYTYNLKNDKKVRQHEYQPLCC